MGKSAPASPPPVDYGQQASAQGQANIDAARVGAQLNRVNQYTPYGSLVYTPTSNPDQWDSTVTLSPDQQALLDKNTTGQLSLADTANSALGRIQSSMGSNFDTSGAPARVNSVNTPNYDIYTGNTSAPVKTLDFSGLGKLPTGDEYGAQKQEVEDALYRQSTARLDPQYAQQEEQLRNQLVNSGITQGSEAFTNAMNDFYRQKQADYGDARDRAITGGGAEQSRLLADALKARGEGVSEIGAQGTFANATSQQDLDSALKAMGFNNATESQGLADSIAAGNFQNSSRAAGLDEAAYLRSLPLNEYNALLKGTQVTSPSFANTPSVASPAPAPVFAAGQAQANNALDLYNQQIAQNNQNSQTAVSLAAGIAAIF